MRIRGVGGAAVGARAASSLLVPPLVRPGEFKDALWFVWESIYVKGNMQVKVSASSHPLQLPALGRGGAGALAQPTPLSSRMTGVTGRNDIMVFSCGGSRLPLEYSLAAGPSSFEVFVATVSLVGSGHTTLCP